MAELKIGQYYKYGSQMRVDGVAVYRLCNIIDGEYQFKLILVLKGNGFFWPPVYLTNNPHGSLISELSDEEKAELL